MGFVDKLKFWRHEPKLDQDLGIDFSNPVPEQNAGQTQEPGEPQAQPNIFQSPYPQEPQRPEYGTPRFAEMRQEPASIQRDSYDKNLEIVSMKLDNIKVVLENMNQRLVNIERIAVESQRQEPPRRPNW